MSRFTFTATVVAYFAVEATDEKAAREAALTVLEQLHDHDGLAELTGTADGVTFGAPFPEEHDLKIIQED